MGFFSTSPKKQQPTMIKIAAVVCLAALASAEADADAFYNTYGYGLNHGLGYTNAYAAGYGINAYAAPLRYSGAYGYAAPAASAAITVRGYGTPATVGSNLPYGYAASSRYVADSVGAVHIAKREAEAEPEAEAEADAYYRSYGYSNLGYSSYAAPAAYSTYSTIARPAIYSRGYYGKREAEAEPEAEADALYSTHSRPLVSSYVSRPIVSRSYVSRPILST